MFAWLDELPAGPWRSETRTADQPSGRGARRVVVGRRVPFGRAKGTAVLLRATPADQASPMEMTVAGDARGLHYVLKRVLFAVGTVVVALTLNFILFRALPGSPANDLSRVPNASVALKDALTKQFGLDKPLWQQYTTYVSQLVHGNLGTSYADQQPVAHELGVALGNTIPMVALGTFVAIGLGIITGVLAAWRRNRLLGRVATTTGIAFFSFPPQWLGLILLILCAGVLPSSGMSDDFLVNPSWWQHEQDVLTHMLLPAGTLALSLYGRFALIVRSATVDTLGEPYILTARAKGLTEWKALWRHALPNAMLPTVTLIAVSIGHVVAGAILIETIFSWPGIGRAVYESILARDYPMLEGAFLLLTVSVVICNLAADLLYARLDPRVRA